ncbi:hypothetical protein [Schaalia cardiffensis]|uniref:hypothetical protein n=1 Tax=Schaalia cardiffensis TaxID=181487 RepID=UPI0023F3AF97|nr:hypothetical protein [Schaalia cardiffensis]
MSTRQVSPALRFAASIIATDLIAGLVGRACTLLLHGVEMIVWNCPEPFYTVSELHASASLSC